MMIGIQEEIFGFLTAVVTGGIVRLVYQCIICFRDIFKHKRISREIEDFLFWISAAVYMFVQIYHTSDGSIRWYFVLGLVFGAAILTVFWRNIERRLQKIYNFQTGENIAKNRKRRYY